MDSEPLARAARERQKVMTKDAAAADTRSKTLRTSGERAKARADKLRATPIKQRRPS